ncbi:TIGR02117 family protein [Uliginosibacterium sp. H3]|uniref:TIGR02117 family protein n=1 Tax=Uliginosibacterium silvisoli TaxID=3114758 RepID=A0ABU6K8R3_9RHOO|nr:TIGR02117 family protein [Uliginosibacterium sp. H3]
MKNAYRIIALVLFTPLLMLLGYFGVACAMLMFPANDLKADAEQEERIAAYVISNGVHADLVLPIRSDVFDWTEIFPARDIPTPLPATRYIAIGWGDREFYLHTREIADITVSRALAALSGRHRSLIHVTRLESLDFVSNRYALPLTRGQYQALILYIRQTLILGADGAATPIAGYHYGTDDAFYEARGKYSLFNTCNTWIGRALRTAGVKASRWTPLDFTVVWHLRKNGTP